MAILNMIYGGGDKLIKTSGIYYNSTLGLISLSGDGTNWTTIVDKNLGATIAYNNGDTMSEANCGKYYQRGNNYGFPFDGAITTSSTQVNAQNYGPGNYYSSSTWITGQQPRDSSSNKNLRGDTTGTNEARRGPCPYGWHVPSYGEITAIKSICGSFDNMITYLKFPLCGYRNYDTTKVRVGTAAMLWSGTPFNNNRVRGYTIRNNGGGVMDYPTRGFMLRPFKNEAVQPDETRTKLY